MAEESEKRFQAVMDKLFHAPPNFKSKSATTTMPTQSPSSSGIQLSRGRKRPMEPKSRGAIVEVLPSSSVSGGSVQTPLCRPWDRGDLMRRLATFKSMTWFAKPQVVNAVNCARRGWINIEMDIIACEACGARILFSSPSSWTRQQVEKAALVFSLKLDNGHKLLCPWVDNACDETLSQFPPTPPAVLVDEYKKRGSVLWQLCALPVISSSAIYCMRSPQLEHFLKGFSTIGRSNESVEPSQTERLGCESETDSSVSYYQAQKLISLCGWEPRLLPYTVDCKNRQCQSSKVAHISDSSDRDGNNASIVVYSSDVVETLDANDDPITSGTNPYDPNSVVLDCRLCGASVGLWAFSTIPRPLELLRLAGYTEVNGEHDSAPHEKDNLCGDIGDSAAHDLCNMDPADNRKGTSDTASTTGTSSSESPVRLNLTIAGGPPPTKQNFRATISVPVIGRNLRARISADSDNRDRLCMRNSFQGGNNHRGYDLTGLVFQPEHMGLLHGKQVDDGQSNFTSIPWSPCLNNDISEQGDTCVNNRICDMSSEGAGRGGQGVLQISIPDFMEENLTQSPAKLLDGSSKNENLPESAESIATVNMAGGIVSSYEVGESSVATIGPSISVRNGEILENDTSTTVEVTAGYLQHNPVTDTCSTLVDIQDGSRIKAVVQPVNSDVVPWSMGKNLDQRPSHKAMEFDPIRQHRHFCPWIASTGNLMPGWQQTLSALQRRNKFSCPLSTDVSTSLIEVDDPVGSVKKLFTPPSAKRMKLTQGSS